MKNNTVIAVLILFVAPLLLIAELENDVLFPEPTEVKGFIFYTEEVEVKVDDEKTVRIRLIQYENGFTEKGIYDFKRWDNIKIFMDVPKNKPEWIHWRKAEEVEEENGYYEIHITKRTFEKISAHVMQELKKHNLIHTKKQS
ncbi:hypothetical protein KY348_01900 [Candidatus Woesearchaeota archaeon]|nr:hypothetical protein [Candidatus Woesearchaeota archaeon]